MPRTIAYRLYIAWDGTNYVAESPSRLLQASGDNRLTSPVGPYRRGFEDRYYDNAWFCPYKPGSTDAREYAAGQGAAAKMERSELP